MSDALSADYPTSPCEDPKQEAIRLTSCILHMHYYENDVEAMIDLFDEDGVCYLQLEEDGHPLYMTVEYQNGYSTSTSCYPAPSGSSAD